MVGKLQQVVCYFYFYFIEFIAIQACKWVGKEGGGCLELQCAVQIQMYEYALIFESNTLGKALKRGVTFED